MQRRTEAVLWIINGKIKYIGSLIRLKENKEVYEDPKEMSEMLNKNFQKIFTIESDYKMPQREKKKNEMLEIMINIEEIK